MILSSHTAPTIIGLSITNNPGTFQNCIIEERYAIRYLYALYGDIVDVGRVILLSYFYSFEPD